MFGGAVGKMKRWLLQESEEPRQAPRAREPQVVVHYWDGSAPEGRRLRDISETGAYIITTERWYVGTIVRIILQGYKTVLKDDGTIGPASSISLPARVIRHGTDGVAVEFAFRDEKEENAFRIFLASIPVQLVAAEPPARPADRHGQALIEFALFIPLVLLLAINAANVGGFIFAWITVADAARAGAQYMVMSAHSPGSPTPATLAQITSLVTQEVSSLMNRASVVVATCTNNNGTKAPANCTTLTDPEPTNYVIATVDVTYTYKPFIPLYLFPRLGISLTLSPSAIHRKAVMRMLQ
jgi:Flp pilus assembly protein TadG